MIIETEMEAEALKFILDLASETTSNAGCNDLDKEIQEKFKNVKIPREDGDGIFFDGVAYDFDIIQIIRIELEKNGYRGNKNE